jgi:poly-gamma-glutamate synthesis protein (capsule biosynthesis protein)
MTWRQRQKLKLALFTIVPVLVGIFSVAFFFNAGNAKVISQPKDVDKIESEISESLAQPVTETDKDDKPKYFYFNKGQNQKPKLSAEAYIVGDLGTGEIILIKNQDKRFPIASVSKLMTALVAKEELADSDVAKVSSRALSTYGGNGGFYLGEKIKVSDLLYPLLLESSNDAAEIIAEHFGREEFLRNMNEHALGLKMSSTSFLDPSGLSEKNLSTVEDIFKLTGYIKQKEPDLLSITTKKSYSNKKHTWFSNNQFLHKKEYLGGKSGYIDEARQTVVSVFNLPLGENTTRPIGIVLLRSQDRYKDVDNILKYLKKYVYYGGAKDANADWIKDKLVIPDIFDPTYVTLTFVGDIMLDRGVKNSVIKNFNGDYSSLFDKLEILKESDIVFANLEGPASDQGKDQNNLYSFRMDPSVVPALKGAGIEVVSVANNHMGDWGRDAFKDTLARLKENEIQYTGGGTKEEAEKPAIVEKYGMKIGYLGFTDVGPAWLEAGSDVEGVLLASDPRYEEIIKNAASLVDHLIVSFHWGDEYQPIHNARQEALAHKAIDAGAKIVVGHHPHVIQDTEVYKNGFIAYSLGNFIFDQKFSQATMQGMMLDLELRKDGSITARKNTVKLNSVFQPDQIIKGKSETIKFLPIQ